MEKIFTPNRWFVGFCALFIAIFVSLQWVINTRLQTYAEKVGENVFTWIWPDHNLMSATKITGTKILKRNETSAIVEVSGDQTISPFDPKTAGKNESEQSKVKAILTFYRIKNDWRLGTVEFE